MCVHVCVCVHAISALIIAVVCRPQGAKLEGTFMLHACAMHVCACVCKCMCACVCMSCPVCVCACVCKCTCACVCVQVMSCVCVCVHVDVCACGCVCYLVLASSLCRWTTYDVK